MLILMRNVGEAVQIGENVSIRIVGSKGKAVRIAIDAPREIPVHREEIYERIKKEEKARERALLGSGLVAAAETLKEGVK